MRYSLHQLSYFHLVLFPILLINIKGDFGTKFYIILSGSVGVKILQKPKLNLDTDSSPKLKENKKVLTEVKILKQGETFGEMALLGNGKRLATIESKDDCTFAVVDK